MDNYTDVNLEDDGNSGILAVNLLWVTFLYTKHRRETIVTTKKNTSIRMLVNSSSISLTIALGCSA